MKSSFPTPCLSLALLFVFPAAAPAQHAYETSSGFYEYSGSAGFGSPRNRDGWTAYAATEWASRYLRRGNQQFGNAGAFAIMLGGGYGPVGVDLEQRIADTTSNREFSANFHATHSVNELDFGARATYFNGLRGEPSNWDLGLGVGGELFRGIRWETEIHYGTEPKNFYADAGLTRAWEFGPDWSLTASAGVGFNLGYQRDARKGADHAAVSVDIAHALSHQSAIYGGIGHYSPINRDTTRYADHQQLHNGFLFRIGARWEY